jgi:hypothetical protein
MIIFQFLALLIYSRNAFINLFIHYFIIHTRRLIGITHSLILLTCNTGQSASEATAVVKEKLWPTMVLNFFIWPPAKFINFKWVPLQHQVSLSVNIAFILSVIIEQYVKHVKNKNSLVLYVSLVLFCM